MYRTLTTIFALLGALSVQPAAAGDHERVKLLDILSARLPGLTPEAVQPTPINGLYEVAVGGQVIYVTVDGQFALTGNLIDWETGRNLTEKTLSKQRLALINKVPESKMIIFEPEGEVRHTITTFTDIDCPYCRLMHSEMGKLNELGIRVRYLFFPRAGVASISYVKAVSVWCAEDQRSEMTRAKKGGTPEQLSCENPVEKHMALAAQLGLNGTPMTITDSGEQIMGYVPAQELFDRMDLADREL